VYSNVKIAGHQVHPLLTAFPVPCYAGRLAVLAVYTASRHLFRLNLAIILNVVGVITAAIAALPGLVDWAFSILRGLAVKSTGLVHDGLNVAAQGLFLADVAVYGGSGMGQP
jgi:uncharacterized membrane protein